MAISDHVWQRVRAQAGVTRSDISDEARRLRHTLRALIFPGGGLLLGAAVVGMYGEPEQGAELVWAALAIATGASAGALFVYGRRRWVSLIAIQA